MPKILMSMLASYSDFHISKRFILITTFIILVCSNIYGGISSKPRKMNVISTKYFDIIFSEETVETAKILSAEADDLYIQAKDTIGAKNEIRIVVVISPDSDTFSVTYSPTPYNRIVIYDAVPDIGYSKYDQILLDAFYHEVLKAVSQSIRNPFIDKVAKIMAVDAFQPVNIFNMPFSFVEGIASLEDENENVLNDNYNLQILMQAKLDGKFPSWINAAGSRDIYPGDELTKLAGIAFAAYIQQRFGLQKYIEFWEKSGSIYFVVFTQGIFYKVYGEKLGTVWKDFVDSIPLPEISEESKTLEEKAETIFEKDFNKLYSNLISTPYGLVWYDDLNHEVSLYNPNSTLQNRRLLFLADGVTKLSADETGRFLSISFLKNKMRDNLHEYQTWIYDLREHSFFSESFDLNDACIVKTKDGLYAVAGVNVQQKNPRISVVLSEDLNEEVYDETDDKKFDDVKQTEIFSRDFAKNDLPYSLTRSSDGFLIGFLRHDNETFFYSVEFENAFERKSLISDDENDSEEKKLISNGETQTKSYKEYIVPLGEIGSGISGLQPLKNHKSDVASSEIYTFQFFPNDTLTFAKNGILSFDSESKLLDISLQKENISGGIYNPVLFNADIYFYSKKTDSSVFRRIETNDLHFEKISLLAQTNGNQPNQEIPPYEKSDELFNPADYQKYKITKYLFHGTWMPMLPVRDLTNETGTEHFPGLGVAYLTQSDPLENNDLTLSFATGFANLNFSNLINPAGENAEKSTNETSLFSDDFVGAAYFKNTTTPINISAGGMFKFKTNGQYDLKILGGTDWTIPFGMPFRKLAINISTVADWATKYNGVYINEEMPDLSGWVNLNDSYRRFEISSGAVYSNVHQAGISPYELRGLEIHAKIYSLWDYAEIDDRPADTDESNAENTGANSTGTGSNAGATNNTLNTGPEASLVSFAVSLKLCAPRLNPLPDYNGWILGLPSTLSIDVLKDIGTAFSAASNILVIGKEIQYGISFLNLYLTRFGLSVGYDLDFDYAVKKNLLPDVRSYKQFTDVFVNTVLNDKISVNFDFVFSPVIGLLSRVGMNGNFKVIYGIQTHEVKFSFNMQFRM